MKKLLFFLPALFTTASLFAQWSTNGTAIYNTNTGNVGIGTGTSFSPQYKFHIYDGRGSGLTGLGFKPGDTTNDNTYILGMKTSSGINGLIIKSQNTSSATGQSAIFIKYGSGTSAQGLISFMSNSLDFRTGTNVSDNITGATFGTSALFITNTQSVGIGTTNPGPYKLAVEGALGARSIKVTLASPWADYVFDKEYKLRSLSSLEDYIKTNNHLPNIPSAGEVQKDGIDLAQINAKLLEKIEELTLYVIQLNKKIESLEMEKKEQVIKK